MNADRSFFNVICSFRSGLGQGTDDLLDNAEVIDRIATGQFQDIVRIFEFNPAEGWAQDVTDEIMLAANIKRESIGRRPIGYIAHEPVTHVATLCNQQAAE